MKTCNKCFELKDSSLFRIKSTVCKKCESAWHAANYIRNKGSILKKNAEWRAANPDQVVYNARQALLRSYKITQADYDALLQKQSNKCAICKSSDTGRKTSVLFLVDHDHKTGKVRGLLCHKCNAAIGMLRDSIEILNFAIEYLKNT